MRGQLPISQASRAARLLCSSPTRLRKKHFEVVWRTLLECFFTFVITRSHYRQREALSAGFPLPRREVGSALQCCSKTPDCILACMEHLQTLQLCLLQPEWAWNVIPASFILTHPPSPSLGSLSPPGVFNPLHSTLPTLVIFGVFFLQTTYICIYMCVFFIKHLDLI